MIDLVLTADHIQFLNLVRTKLGGAAHNRFRAALAEPSWLLRDRVLKPNLFKCVAGRDITEGTYYPVAVRADTPGRNHELALRLTNGAGGHLMDDPETWGALAYFANALRPCRPDWDETIGRDIWQPPSERVAIGSHYIITYEYDVADIAFLREQMSWLNSKKKASDSAMGRLFARLSEYADFVGLTVVYSGNKSLHIHAVFDLLLASETLHLNAIGNPRPGFVAHWHRLLPALKEVLGLAGGVEPDPALSFPESYRRIPNGHRLVEGRGHLLGVPAGTWVKQIVLWEKWRARTAANTAGLFFRPEPFRTSDAGLLRQARPSTSAKSAQTGGDLTPDQHTFCEQMLRNHYRNWPKLNRLTHERGRWIAYFSNSPADGHASSILREDFSSIHLVGTDARTLYPEPLPLPLGQMIRLWVRHHDRQHQNRAEVSAEQVVILPRSGTVGNHPLEIEFQEAARDPSSARLAAQRFFPDAIAANQQLWVCGPEGAGKTSTLFVEHSKIVSRILDDGDPELVIYAFGDYETAREKCEDFNVAQGGNGFVGVVLPSFNQAYTDACQLLGLEPLSQSDAASRGHSSLWTAVKAVQPRVMEVFRTRHAAMWERIGVDRIVAFTVHQVLHGWDLNSPSRAMWSRSFWDAATDEAERRRRALHETGLGLAIHDEVRLESLVEIQPRAVFEWVQRLTAQHQGAHAGAGLDRQFAAYEEFLQAEGNPKIGEQVIEMTFDVVRRLIPLADRPWSFVTTRDSGEYVIKEEVEAGADGDRPDIYAARHGRCWAILPRLWWQGVADHIVVLTTEALPTAVAQMADPAWSIFELQAPNLPRDVVEVHAIKGVTAGNLASLCGEWRHRLGLIDAWVVSNRVAKLPNSMTHARARGNNALVGRNVIQTMTFMHPAEYEEVQALNAWMKRSDACLLRHIDEFNQTAGRNLGFRGRAGVQHHLLINPRLLLLLMEGGLGHSRYDLRVNLDRGQRYRLKSG